MDPQTRHRPAHTQGTGNITQRRLTARRRLPRHPNAISQAEYPNETPSDSTPTTEADSSEASPAAQEDSRRGETCPTYPAPISHSRNQAIASHLPLNERIPARLRTSLLMLEIPAKLKQLLQILFVCLMPTSLPPGRPSVRGHGHAGPSGAAWRTRPPPCRSPAVGQTAETGRSR